MIITDQAKVLLTQMLTENGHDSLQVALQQGCCGSSVYFTFTDQKDHNKPIIINGIPVVMDETIADRADTVTIETDDEGKLKVVDSAQKSGCC